MINKSDYTNYLTCPNLYYLRKYHKELEAPLSIIEETNISNGFKVQEYARGYFGEYHLIDRTNKPSEELYKETLKAIKDGHKIICEASFIYKDLFCAVDLLKINDDGSVSIYEVKSAKNLNPIYYDDVAFQRYVLEALGYKVRLACLLHPSPDYIFKDYLNIKEYFKQEDEEFKDDVKDNIDKIRQLDKQINVKASQACKGCGFFDVCYKEMERPSVLDLAGNVGKYDMFNNGIKTFKEFLVSNYANKSSNTMRNAVQQAKFEAYDLPMHVNKIMVKEFLDSLTYPLYYLDFETVKDLFPFINGTNISFPRIMQYSLHIQEYMGGPLKHLEYLQEAKYDNLKEVAERLILDLGTSGSILVYSSFEENKIETLKRLVPECQSKLEAIRLRLVDMAIPFKNRDVYLKELKGRYTIKYVLPALCPEFNKAYASLPLVHNGGQIDMAYEQLIKPNNKDHDFIKNSLLQYCELDTLAEVKIIEKLYELVK